MSPSMYVGILKNNLYLKYMRAHDQCRPNCSEEHLTNVPKNLNVRHKGVVRQTICPILSAYAMFPRIIVNNTVQYVTHEPST